MNIQAILPVCDAIVRLLSPLVEIVIHDIKQDSIAYLAGNLSKRKIGDPSMLGDLSLADADKAALETVTYAKLNFDGRLIKSISVPYAHQWLICINCDISVFHAMDHLAKQFLATSDSKLPEVLFKSDWQEKLHITIHSLLEINQWHFKTLTSAQKKAIVTHLYQSGAFSEKKAADYVAQTLNMGRATVFNYLKILKQSQAV